MLKQLFQCQGKPVLLAALLNPAASVDTHHSTAVVMRPGMDCLRDCVTGKDTMLATASWTAKHCTNLTASTLAPRVLLHAFCLSPSEWQKQY